MAGFPSLEALRTCAASIPRGGRDPFEQEAIDLRPEAHAQLAGARRAVLQRLALAYVREELIGHVELSPGAALVRWTSGALHVTWKGEASYLHPAELETSELTHPLELHAAALDELAERFGVERLARFGEELCSSVANLALVRAAAEARRSRLNAEGVRSITQWEERFASPDALRHAFETLVVDGHGSHPCTRTRHGMSFGESLQYSPELEGERLELRFVALSRSISQVISDYEERLADTLPEACASARGELTRRGLPIDQFVLLPVHPWQREHRLEQLFAEEIAGGAMVPLETRAAASPQLSLRTVEPIGARVPSHHLKLALGVQTTSAERTISPQSVNNGPRVGALLTKLVRESNAPVHIIREMASAGVDPERLREPGDRPRHLACILRENPSLLPSRSSRPPILSAALSGPSPFSGRSLAGEYVRLASSRLEVPEGEATRRFFDRACQTLLRPTLLLVARYGVALEAHAQNCLFVVDEDGLPAELAVRDFGGLRMHMPTLEAAGHHFEPYPGSAPDAKDLEEVEAKFIHCVLQTHLRDLFFALERDVPGALGSMGERVGGHLGEALGRIGGAGATRLEAAVFAPTLRLKRLTAMRLTGVYSKYLYATVPNPLVESGRG